MAIVDASGSASGIGTVVGTAAQLYHFLGSALGTSVSIGRAGIISLWTGRAIGVGQLSYFPYIDVTGQSVGSVIVVGTVYRTSYLTGSVNGTGTLSLTVPNPIEGLSGASAYLTVERVKPPLDSKLVPQKTLRYLQNLQQRDLPLYLSSKNNPTTPYKVSYNLYQIASTGIRVIIGPSNRQPSIGKPGEYYATGRAGEFGQPGKWLIVWQFQRTYQSAVQVVHMCFMVKDATAAKDSLDVTIRCKKFGWD